MNYIRSTTMRFRTMLVLTTFAYLAHLTRTHFNQMLTDAIRGDGHVHLYSKMNVVYQLSYMLVQLLACYADRFNPGPFLGMLPLGLATTSSIAPFLLSTLSPESSYASIGTYALGVLFAINGAIAGCWWPLLNMIVANWSPPDELAYMYATINTGIPGGIALGNAFTGMAYSLKDSKSRYSFYIVSIVCVLWSVIWLWRFYSYPSDDPHISTEELEHLSTTIKPKIKLPVPWSKILSSRAVWILVFTNYGSSIFYTVLIMYMPMYLKDAMKVELSRNGFLSSLPPIGQIFIMFTAGYCATIIQRRQWLKVTNIRKLFTFTGMIIPAFAVMTATFFTNHSVFYGCLVFAYSISGSVFSGYRVGQMEVAPNFVATVTALCDLSSSLAMNSTHMAFIFLVGKTTEQITWNSVCWTMFSALVVGATPYILLGSSDPQPWNGIEQTNA